MEAVHFLAAQALCTGVCDGETEGRDAIAYRQAALEYDQGGAALVLHRIIGVEADKASVRMVEQLDRFELDRLALTWREQVSLS